MKLQYLGWTLAAGLLATAANAQQPPQPYANGANGQPYCREFTQKVVIAGQTHTGYGTSCMRPDGTWQVVSNPLDNPTPPPPANYAPPVDYPPPPGYGYVVAPPPGYYAYPAPYYYGPSVGIGFDIGHGGYYHDHGYRR